MDDTTDDGMRDLYRRLLDAWNRRDGPAMASLFTDSGHVVGFDGTQVNGRAAIAAHLAPIFARHATPRYVAVVRGVRELPPATALLWAHAGLVPAGRSDIDPALNAVQTLIGERRDGKWRIELFQNTPAAFHGRPEEGERLSGELRAALAK